MCLSVHLYQDGIFAGYICKYLMKNPMEVVFLRYLMSVFGLLLFSCSAMVSRYHSGFDLFDDSRIHKIEIEISEKAFRSVVMARKKNSKGKKLYGLIRKVVIDGRTISNAGMRTRGNTSIYNRKRQFKISFSASKLYTGKVGGVKVCPENKKRRVFGLRQFNLRSSQNDPTLLREKLSSFVFHLAGVPVPRVSFGKVIINGKPWGLYSIVEQVDSCFLKRNGFSGKGGLFKNEGGFSFTKDSVKFLSFKRGRSVKRRATESLNNLLHAVGSGDVNAIEKHIDGDAVIRYWAASAVVGHWDSLIGDSANDYLYFDPDNSRLRIIPWDMDNTIGSDFVGDCLYADPFYLNKNFYSMVDMSFPWMSHPRAFFSDLIKNQNFRKKIGMLMLAIIRKLENGGFVYSRIRQWKRLIASGIKNDPMQFRNWKLKKQKDAYEIWRSAFVKKPSMGGYRGWIQYHHNLGLTGWFRERCRFLTFRLKKGRPSVPEFSFRNVSKKNGLYILASSPVIIEMQSAKNNGVVKAEIRGQNRVMNVLTTRNSKCRFFPGKAFGRDYGVKKIVINLFYRNGFVSQVSYPVLYLTDLYRNPRIIGKQAVFRFYNLPWTWRAELALFLPGGARYYPMKKHRGLWSVSVPVDLLKGKRVYYKFRKNGSLYFEDFGNPVNEGRSGYASILELK